ncbi:MAG: heavy metal-binding protein [Segetibacter sp.]|nr:heavy metal-binding protein [Segetibacter sp.]
MYNNNTPGILKIAPTFIQIIMITTTTNNIEGRPVQQYLGVVSSESIIGANIFKDLFAGIRDIVGGRSATYEKVIDEARTNALQELVQKAESIGANAIIGIDLDFETVGTGGSMLMVIATGTAVRI